MTPPSIKEQLKELILGSLEVPYISESSHEGIQTGNHYQSLQLDNEVATAGFRTPRSELLDQIDFESKRVLDLGSNFGELSRAARERGASLVDGYEYDPFFVEIARAVNAYKGVSRVSFYERDITDPAIFVESYDVVLGFSVFIYMQTVLDKIAAITDGILIVETHKLNDNLETTYLTPLSRYFPFYAILGESEWGTNQAAEEKRAVLAFAKERRKLAAGLVSPAGVRSTGAVSASIPASAPRPAEESAAIDSSRTPWMDKFFAVFEFDTCEDALDAARCLECDLDSLGRSNDLRRHVMNGWMYWFVFLKGLIEYQDRQHLTNENVYVRYLREYYPLGSHDPALVAQVHGEGGLARIEARFRECEAILTEGRISPITIVAREDTPANAKVVYRVPGGEAIVATLIDGYHRLFAARLAGVASVPATIVFQQASDLPILKGEVERLPADGSNVRLEGWVDVSSDSCDAVELWVDGTVVARSPLFEAEQLPDDTRPQGLSTFRMVANLPGAAPQESAMRVIATQKWRTVGEIPPTRDHP